MASVDGTIVDARPIIERTEHSGWSRATAHCHEVYDGLTRASARESLDALVLKSPPAVSPPWVKFQAWIPRAGRSTTERVEALITVEPKPFHERPLEIKIAFTRHGRQ